MIALGFYSHAIYDAEYKSAYSLTLRDPENADNLVNSVNSGDALAIAVDMKIPTSESDDSRTYRDLEAARFFLFACISAERSLSSDSGFQMSHRSFESDLTLSSVQAISKCWPSSVQALSKPCPSPVQALSELVPSSHAAAWRQRTSMNCAFSMHPRHSCAASTPRSLSSFRICKENISVIYRENGG